MGLCGSAKIKVYEFDPDEAGMNHKQKKKFDRLCRELQIHEEDITKFYSVWRKIEPTGENLISEHDYLSHLHVEETPFLTKALTIKDDLGHNDPTVKNIDFIHFFLKTYQICALSDVGLNCFAFELYDVDQGGVIDVKELKALAKDMYGEDYEHDHRLTSTFKKILKDHPNTVTLKQFETVIFHYPLLTFPAHQAQKDLQKHTGGTSWWKHLTERRLLGHEQGALYALKHIWHKLEGAAEEVTEDVTGHKKHHHHHHHHHDEGEAHGTHVRHNVSTHHESHKKDKSPFKHKNSAGLTFH